nr:hypothetical protein [Clostridia bacterium]
MKKVAAIFYAFFVVITAFSCRGDYAERNMDLTDKLCGRYTCGSDETEDSETLEISYINGSLILEVSEKYAAYYASELINYSPEALDDFNAAEISVTAMTFSGFSDNGKYFEPENYTITINGYDGITLVYRDGTSKTYTRDDESAPIHNAPSYYTEILGSTADTALTGEWSYTDGERSLYIIMEENCAFTYCDKRTGEPIDLKTGAYTAGDGTMTVLAERCGYANMPYNFTFTYSVNEDTLTLTTDEEEITLTKTTK